MQSIGERLRQSKWVALSTHQQALVIQSVQYLHERTRKNLIKKKKQRVPVPRPSDRQIVEDRIQMRVDQRRRAFLMQEAADVEERAAKVLVAQAILPDLQQRLLRKSPADIIRECDFLDVTIPDSPTLDQLRSLFRRALALQHPDRTRHLPTIEKRVEAEEWFKLLNVTYQKIK